MPKTSGTVLDARKGGVGINVETGPARPVDESMRCASGILQIDRALGQGSRLRWPHPVVRRP